MNWVDFTILGIIFFSTVISYFRGFLREAISLTVWVLGIVLALKFAPVFQDYFESFIRSPGIRYAVTFVIIFVLILILGTIINFSVKLLLHKTGINLSDRLIGLIFGALRGVFLVVVMLMFMNMMTGKEKTSKPLEEAALVPYFKPLVNKLETYLPERLKAISYWISEEDTA